MPDASSPPKPPYPTGGRPPPVRSRSRRVAIVTLALGACATAAAFVRWPVPRDWAAATIAQRIDREVRIGGPVSVRLAPQLSIHGADVVVGPPSWLDASHFARAQRARVSLSWPTLLAQRPVLTEVALEGADVALVLGPDGRTSWDFPQRDGATVRPVIERLQAVRSTWRYADPSRPTRLEGTIELVDGTLSDRPRVEIAARGTRRDLPVQATVTGGSLLAAADAGRQPLAATISVGRGRFEFNGSADRIASLAGVRGAFAASGPGLEALGDLLGVTLPRTRRFAMQGELERLPDAWRVRIASARIGESDLDGELVYTAADADRLGRLSGRLRSTRMRVADLGYSFGFGASEPARQRRGRVLPDIELNLPSLRHMDADVQMAVERLDVGPVDPIRALRARISVERGALAIGSLDAQVAGGRLSGEVVIDATRDPGRMRARLRLNRLLLDRWLPPFQGAPPLRSILNGELSLTGTGASVAQVLARSEGYVRVAMGPGEASNLALELAGIDIAETLGLMIGGNRMVRLNCGVVDMKVRRGVGTPGVMLVDTTDTLVSGNGTLDLGSEQLALRFAAAPKDFSPLTLRAPLLVTGTLSAPRVAVEKAPIAERLVASAVLAAAAGPLAALLPMLDFGDDKGESPCRGLLAKHEAQERDQRQAPGPPSR